MARILFLLGVVLAALLLDDGHRTWAFAVVLAAGVVGLVPVGLAMRRASRRGPDGR